MTEAEFKQRLDKPAKIEQLKINDKKKVNDIIRVLSQKNTPLEPKVLKGSLCGKGMSSKRYYPYLNWLKKCGYISQEKRRGTLELTENGKGYWLLQTAIKDLQETGDREAFFQRIFPAIKDVIDKQVAERYEIIKREYRVALKDVSSDIIREVIKLCFQS